MTSDSGNPSDVDEEPDTPMEEDTSEAADTPTDDTDTLDDTSDAEDPDVLLDCTADPNDDDEDGVCNALDQCEGFDDANDTDGDGIPNGCDTCEAEEDTDGDGVPDDCDICEGSDDNEDENLNGVPDGCECTTPGVCPINAICEEQSEAAVECTCLAGYAGEGCININECDEMIDDCGVSQVCVDIDGGFTCACEEGRFGPECTGVCDCNDGICTDGIEGDGSCTCPEETFGANCAACACTNGACDDGVDGSGSCSCDEGWYGTACDTPCDQGNCLGIVACAQEDEDDRVCDDGCEEGFWGVDCAEACVQGNCLGVSICAQDGTALDCDLQGCVDGFWGDGCEEICTQGNCLGQETCDRDGSNSQCDDAGCAEGFWGPGCSIPCVQGNCVGTLTCDRDGSNRLCQACIPGYLGPSCQQEDRDRDGVGFPEDACDDNPLTLGGVCGCDAAPSGEIVYDLTMEPTTYQWREMVESTALDLSDDDLSDPLDIGFAFPFFGEVYETIRVSSNGWLTFADEEGTQPYTAQTIPNPTPPNNLIAAFWSDLNPENGGTIQVGTFGEAPEREFIAQFEGVPHFNDPSPVTLQVVLKESDASVEIHCQECPSSTRNHTQGYEGPGGVEAVTLPGRNNSEELALFEDGVVIRSSARQQPAITPTAFQWRPAPEIALTLTDDDLTEPIDLGFVWTYQGQTYEAIRVSSNGWLTFADEEGTRPYDAQTLPDPAAPNDLIAAYWGDLNPEDGGTIQVGTQGEAPEREFVIQFEGVPHFDNPATVTFQIVFKEGTQTAEVHCLDCQSGGLNHTQGYEGATGAVTLSGRNAANFDLVEDAVVLDVGDARGTVPIVAIAPYQFIGRDSQEQQRVQFEDNGASLPIDLGFEFEWDGVQYTQVFVHKNGYIAWDEALTSRVSGFRKELNDLGQVHTVTLGEAPNRRFVVLYDRINSPDDPDTFQSFNIVVRERDGLVEVQCGMCDSSSGVAFQGVEGSSAGSFGVHGAQPQQFRLSRTRNMLYGINADGCDSFPQLEGLPRTAVTADWPYTVHYTVSDPDTPLSNLITFGDTTLNALEPPALDCIQLQGQSGPGCEASPTCEAAVCDADPSCCGVGWDGLCARCARGYGETYGRGGQFIDCEPVGNACIGDQTSVGSGEHSFELLPDTAPVQGTVNVTATDLNTVNTVSFDLTLADTPQFSNPLPEESYPNPGESVTLVCDATATGPLTYRWTRNGEVLDGETGRELVFTVEGVEDNAVYQCTVTSSDSRAVSNPSEITVTEPQFSGLPDVVVMDVGSIFILPFEVTHPTQVDTLTLTAISADQDVVPNGQLTFDEGCLAPRLVQIESFRPIPGCEAGTDALLDFRIYTYPTNGNHGNGEYRLEDALTSPFQASVNTASGPVHEPLLGCATQGASYLWVVASDSPDGLQEDFNGAPLGRFREAFNIDPNAEGQQTADPIGFRECIIVGARQTLDVTYSILGVPDTLTRELRIDAEQIGTTTLTLEAGDGTNATTHTIELRVVDGCDPGQLPTVPNADLNCEGVGSEQVCTLACAPEHRWRDPELSRDTQLTATCPDGNTWQHDFDGRGCDLGQVSLETYLARTVKIEQGLPAQTFFTATDPDGLVGELTIEITSSNPALINPEELVVRANCPDPRSLIIDRIDGDRVDDDFTEIKRLIAPLIEETEEDETELELRLTSSDKPLLNTLEYLTVRPGTRIFDHRFGRYFGTVCGPGRLIIDEIDVPSSFLNIAFTQNFADNPDSSTINPNGATATNLADFYVEKLQGQACGFDAQCLSGDCGCIGDTCEEGEVGRCRGVDDDSPRSIRMRNGDEADLTVVYRITPTRTSDVELIINPSADLSGDATLTITITDADGFTDTDIMRIEVQPRCLGMTPGLDTTNCDALSDGDTCEVSCAAGYAFNTGDEPTQEYICDEGIWVSNNPARSCRSEAISVPPNTSLFETEQGASMDQCGAYDHYESFLPDNCAFCSWSGGDRDWAYAAYGIDAGMRVANREGAAQTAANEGSNDPCQTTPTCQMAKISTSVSAFATVSLLEEDYTIVDALLAGEVDSGRPAGACNCGDPELAEAEPAGGTLDAHLTLFEDTLIDEHRNLPSEPATLGPVNLTVLDKCKTAVLIVIPVTACLELTAEVEINLDASPAFDIPTYYGATVNADPTVRLNTTVRGGIGVQEAGLFLRMGLTLVQLDIRNLIDAQVATASCADTNRPELTLSGTGELDVSLLSGSLGGEACLWPFGCYTDIWFTWPAVELDPIELYEFTADPIDL